MALEIVLKLLFFLLGDTYVCIRHQSWNCGLPGEVDLIVKHPSLFYIQHDIPLNHHVSLL